MRPTRSDVVRVARTTLGTPHVHHGRVPGKDGAMDCAGLLLYVGWTLGIVPKNFDFVNYAEENDGGELERIIRMFADEIHISEAREGDILVMKVAQFPQHCGFRTDVGVIHSTERVVEHAIDGAWPRRIKKAFKLREVVDG